jgi:hypothetical protein
MAACSLFLQFRNGFEKTVVGCIQSSEFGMVESEPGKLGFSKEGLSFAQTGGTVEFRVTHVSCLT